MKGNVSRRKYVVFTVVMSAAIALAGCIKNIGQTPQQTIQETAYKSLVIAADSYAITMQGLGAMAKQGILTQADTRQVIEYGQVYYTAYQAASRALYAYAVIANADTEAKLTTALAAMSRALTEFELLAKPYMRH